MLSYDIVNVFIADGKPYSGNPLAVIYGAEELSQEQCQALGRQFNLSEITFPYDISQDSYSLRIFTPALELPFAGHEHASRLSAASGQAIQTSLSGKTKLSFPKSVQTSDKPVRIRMRAEAHFVTARLPYGLDQLAAVLGHTEQQAKYVRRASCGLPWLYTELNSEEAVVQTRASVSHLKSYCNGLHANLGGEDAREPWLTGLVAFAVVGQEDGQVQIKARVFFDENGTLIEDSATGSAALGLGLVLHQEGILSAEMPNYKIYQGYEILKPSQLYGAVELQGNKAVAVEVAGDVVKVGHGEIGVP